MSYGIRIQFISVQQIEQTRIENRSYTEQIFSAFPFSYLKKILYNLDINLFVYRISHYCTRMSRIMPTDGYYDFSTLIGTPY